MSNSDRPVPVWVDEPHAVVRRGMVTTLEAGGFAVVGESAGLLPAPDTARAEMLIFAADGAGAAAALRHVGRRPVRAVRLVATLRAPAERQLHELAAAGVAAIVLHDEMTPELLLDTARTVGRDRTCMPADLLPRLLERAADLAKTSQGALTTRERDVLRLLSEGQDTRGIALDLSYSERTVKNVVHDVLTKLNCRTRAQAVGMATRAGVI